MKSLIAIGDVGIPFYHSAFTTEGNLDNYVNIQAQNRNDILERFDFAVPVFHAYGHSAKYQVCQWSFMHCIHITNIHVLICLHTKSLYTYKHHEGTILWSL